MPLRLGIDIDGVLADFRNAFRDTARDCLRRDVVSEAATDNSLNHVDIDRVWNHIARSPNWWMSVRAYEPAQIANLYALARSVKWEVCFLTKRPAKRGRRRSVSDPVVAGAAGLLSARRHHRPGFARRSRQRAAARSRHRRSVRQLRGDHRRRPDEGPADAARSESRRCSSTRSIAAWGWSRALAETMPILQRLHELL